MKNEEEIKTGTPTVQEFMKRFKREEDAAKFITDKILPCGEVVCPYCGCTEKIYRYEFPRTYHCGHCRKSISFFNGTMFEGLHMNFKDWLYIIYSQFVSRKSVSSLQLTREINRSKHTILTTRRRIQTAMANYDLEPFKGIIQIDEAYIGGANHGKFNRNGTPRKQKKYPVLGIYNLDTKRVYSYPAIKNEKGQYLTMEQLKTFITKTCAPGSTIVSDDFRSYRFLGKPKSGYHHQVVNHSEKLYVNEEGYSTNGIEGYWGIVKKTYYSTHGHFSRQWAHLYLAETDFRYNYTDWEEAVDTILKQGVFFPRVIDIRQMERFANKTYNLKDYRMILPKCFDDIDVEKISFADIINCNEPVYGILREQYSSKRSRGFKEQKYPEDWESLSLIKGGVGYKDYRNVIINTQQDVEDMLKDAQKHKDVNTYTVVPMKKKRECKTEEYKEKNRIYRMRKAYEQMPNMLRLKIKEEYPRMFHNPQREKTTEVRKRMTSLMKWYNQNIEYLEGE